MRVQDYPMPDSEKWSEVDDYFSRQLTLLDPDFDCVLTTNAKSGLPAHDVSATQGKMLALFIRMLQAKSILEIGTLGGYSTLWMARELVPDGKITTLEADEHHAKVAATNLQNAGVLERVDLRVGAALDILPSLQGPFDFIFIDADKKNNPQYLQWALKLSRPGTVIIADNIVRGGAVLDADSDDNSVKGVREFFTLLHDNPHVDATAIQTVGEKGWDGFVMAVVKA